MLTSRHAITAIFVTPAGEQADAKFEVHAATCRDAVGRVLDQLPGSDTGVLHLTVFRLEDAREPVGDAGWEPTGQVSETTLRTQPPLTDDHDTAAINAIISAWPAPPDLYRDTAITELVEEWNGGPIEAQDRAAVEAMVDDWEAGNG